MKKNISIIYFLLFVYSIANAQDSLYFRANAYKEQLDNYYSMDEKIFLNQEAFFLSAVPHWACGKIPAVISPIIGF